MYCTCCSLLEGTNTKQSENVLGESGKQHEQIANADRNENGLTKKRKECRGTCVRSNLASVAATPENLKVFGNGYLYALSLRFHGNAPLDIED